MSKNLPHPGRRTFLLKTLGGVGVAVAGVYTWRTPLALAIMTRAIMNKHVPEQGISFLDTTTCIVTPQTSEGPYYIDEDYVHGAVLRRDVRDGKPGADVRLKFKIVSATTCRPLVGVAVDIWSCDASGYYSGHPTADPNQIPFGVIFTNHVVPTTPDRALRGRQISDADGFVEFLTLYPGWYVPRAVHVHVMVVDARHRLAVTQLFFPQALTDEIHVTPPYRTRGPSPITNGNDGLIGSEGPGAGWPKMTKAGAAYTGTLTIGVHES